MVLGLLRQGDWFMFAHCRCEGAVFRRPGASDISDIDIVLLKKCDKHRGMPLKPYDTSMVSSHTEVRVDRLAAELEDYFA